VVSFIFHNRAKKKTKTKTKQTKNNKNKNKIKRPEVSAQQQSEQLKGRQAIRAKNNR